MKDLKTQLAALKRGVAEIYPEDQFRELLEGSIKKDRPLRVKLGIDPSAPDIHLGHTVQMRKLRQFQDFGHKAVLIIGDYTAMVGDPSGQSATRPQLSEEEVKANAETYFQQAGRIIDVDAAEIRYNGEWFAPMQFKDVLKLAGKITVARVLERDDFATRMAERKPLSVHELLYPLMQGWDSVMIKSDIELGGTDQKFNLTVGRDLQRQEGQEPQVCMNMPLIPGTDGTLKMSKSLGNYVGVTEAPNEIFGKIMSIPDSLMHDYMVLLTSIDEGEIRELIDPMITHPRDAKVRLAREIVSSFYAGEAAEDAAAEFDRRFKEGKLPSDLAEIDVPESLSENGKVYLPKLLTHCGFAASSSEARRLIAQGGVSIDGDKIEETREVEISDGTILKVGKRKVARLKPKG